MSDAASALALLTIQGAAAPVPGGASPVAKAGGLAADAQAGEGFAAFVLAAGRVAAPNTAALLSPGKTDPQAILVDVKTLAGAKVKTPANGQASAQTDTGKKDDAADPLMALALQNAATPLPLAPVPVPVAPGNSQDTPVPDAPLTEEAKAAFVKAAESAGKKIAPPASKTESAAAPALPANADTAAQSVAAAVGAAANTSPAADAPAAPAPSGTQQTQSAKPGTGTPIDPASAALPPPSVSAEPASVLATARGTVETKTANASAIGTKSDVLSAASNLITPDAPPKHVESLTLPKNGPSVAPPPPAPDHKAAQASRPADLPQPHAKPDAPSPAPLANAAADKLPSASPPAPAAGGGQTPSSDLSAAPQSASAPSASVSPLHSDAQPTPPMTVIRADMQAGQTTLPAGEIAVTIARQFRQGVNRFEIRLDPAELGRIDVRLDLGHGGRATATLTVDRPETLQLLTRDSRALEQTLQDAGIRTDAGSLNFMLRDQNGRQQQTQDQGGGATPQPQAQDDKPKTTATPVTLIATLEPGRLDMRV